MARGIFTYRQSRFRSIQCPSGSFTAFSPLSSIFTHSFTVTWARLCRHWSFHKKKNQKQANPNRQVRQVLSSRKLSQTLCRSTVCRSFFHTVDNSPFIQHLKIQMHFSIFSTSRNLLFAKLLIQLPLRRLRGRVLAQREQKLAFFWHCIDLTALLDFPLTTFDVAFTEFSSLHGI